MRKRGSRDQGRHCFVELTAGLELPHEVCVIGDHHGKPGLLRFITAIGTEGSDYIRIRDSPHGYICNQHRGYVSLHVRCEGKVTPMLPQKHELIFIS